MNSGLQHQQPFTRSAAVRSAPSPRAATRLDMHGDTPIPVRAAVAPEEKSVQPRLER
jgi:hypothetical protein